MSKQAEEVLCPAPPVPFLLRSSDTWQSFSQEYHRRRTLHFLLSLHCNCRDTLLLHFCTLLHCHFIAIATYSKSVHVFQGYIVYCIVHIWVYLRERPNMTIYKVLKVLFCTSLAQLPMREQEIQKVTAIVFCEPCI